MSGFKPGRSGNPKGRPKEYQELKELCREYTFEAVEALVEVLRTGQNREKVIAANALLDRGYGKAEQYVDVSGTVTKFVVRLPPQMDKVEDWQKNYAPKVQ